MEEGNQRVSIDTWSKFVGRIVATASNPAFAYAIKSGKYWGLRYGNLKFTIQYHAPNSDGNDGGTLTPYPHIRTHTRLSPPLSLTCGRSFCYHLQAHRPAGKTGKRSPTSQVYIMRVHNVKREKRKNIRKIALIDRSDLLPIFLLSRASSIFLCTQYYYLLRVCVCVCVLYVCLCMQCERGE